MILALAALLSAAPVQATATRLCRGGKPTMPLVVAAAAGRRTRRAAKALAADLGRVCGGAFEVREGDGSSGLVLGRAADFPKAAVDAVFDAPEPLRREQYLLRSSEGRLLALAAEEAGVDAAAADLVARVGWRRYFPSRRWEIVPSVPDLALEADTMETPAFAARRIWYGYGGAEHNREDFAEWQRRNRVPGSYDLHTGHAAAGVLRRRAADFTAHPEYLALVKGRRTGDKFCLSNPGLRRLIGEDAIGRFIEEPDRDTTSLEPSDGAGWCECAACAALGSPSERLVLLANEVAVAVSARFPGKSVAFYAYNLHSPAPKTQLAGPIVVSVATAYLSEGLDPEGLLRAWSSRGAMALGLREYYGVFQWHASLPGRSRGADLSYLARTLPAYRALGVRFVSAEAGEDWGTAGLGYYAASRLLWSTAEARRIEAIREEFLEKAFGSARGQMRRYYELVDGVRGLEKRAVPAELPRRLYETLAEAYDAASDDAARGRIADLGLYARYVELYRDYDLSTFGRGEAFTRLVAHARRMRDRQLVHLRALLEYTPTRDARAVVPADEGAPFYDDAESLAILRRGAGRGA